MIAPLLTLARQAATYQAGMHNLNVYVIRNVLERITIIPAKQQRSARS